MRNQQQRLQAAGITPGAQALGSNSRVRNGQGRAGRGSSSFSGLNSLLSGLAQIVGKAGKAQGEQDARLFFQVREGETQEERDTRVQEQTAKLLNKNPLLASSSTPQFHKTLAILQGGRASDLISAAVEARQSELLDLKTDAGILNSNIPTVNDIVNEVLLRCFKASFSSEIREFVSWH